MKTYYHSSRHNNYKRKIKHEAAVQSVHWACDCVPTNACYALIEVIVIVMRSRRADEVEQDATFCSPPIFSSFLSLFWK
jgi:hypothetical protein